ncbi:hypothetical protein MAPG_07353 [Magnaporthiopsis poae ATCC 64411]|uniref:Uncharacterized protein n=1 Tax=Magnaporthiopsis poae (strain ATCC 64411 / 73-15) TaxID=644358 RepID=A0A0C4E4G0_MAGP6|nr:hypothetical protein MAPG_07353 [Magnaporthiopsis poae ATCC 64411]
MEIVAGILEERREGGEDEDEDGNREGFELAIPPAGTAPSATTAVTGTAATATRAPMIRPLSSSGSEASSSSGDNESSPPILQRNFDVENGPTKAATATNPSVPAGRPTRSRSHCVSVSMPTRPTSLPANGRLSNPANAAAFRPRPPQQQPVPEESETSSSGTSSEEDDEGESEEEEEDGNEDEGNNDEDEDDSDTMEDTDSPPAPVPVPVPVTATGARPAPSHDGGVAAIPDGSRKRSCTESSLVRDAAAVQSRSDRKRVRPLIEEIE